MTGYLFSSYLTDFWRTKKWLAWFGLLLGLVGLVFIWTSVRRGGFDADSFVRAAEFMGLRLVAFVAALFATSVIAAEVEQKTIVYLVTRPIPRWQILLGKSLAAGVVCSAFMCAVLIGVSFATMRGIDANLLMKGIVAVTLGSFAYMSIYVMFSLLFNRALLYSLLYAFGWESLLANMPGQVYYLSIHNHMVSVANFPKRAVPQGSFQQGMAQTFGEQVIAIPTAYAVLIGVTIVLTAFNLFWFTRNEYVPREDAE